MHFENFIQCYLTDTIFLLIPFSNIKKAYLQILKNLAQFFCSSLFQILKKSIFTNLKKSGTIFCLSLFQILRILKTTLFILITIYINTIIQINKHEAKYIITTCIPIIVIKKFLLFIKTIYNYIYKKNFLRHTIIKTFICLLNIKMVNPGLNLSLNELRLIAEHRNISDYENKSAKDLIKALRGSRPRLGIKKIS